MMRKCIRNIYCYFINRNFILLEVLKNVLLKNMNLYVARNKEV